MGKSKIVIISVLAAILVIALVLLFFASPYFIPRNIERALGYHPEKITKILIINGNTGLNAEIYDPADIREFLSMFKGVSVKKIPGEIRDGFSLGVFLYSDDGHVYTEEASFICNPGRIIRQGETWYSTNKDLTVQELHSIYEKYHIGFAD